MEANLDMNSQRIINLPEPASMTDPVRLTDLLSATLPAPAIAGLATTSLDNVTDTTFRSKAITIGDETVAKSLDDRFDRWLNPLAYGIVGDYAVNDSDQLDQVIDDMLRYGKKIKFDGTGRLKLTRQHTVDLSAYSNGPLGFTGPSNGFMMEGDGHQKTILDLRGVSTYPNFQVISTGAANYGIIKNISFFGDQPGYVFGVGGTSLVGPEMNFFQMEGVNVQNFNTTSSSRAIVVNGLYGGGFTNSIFNCGTGGYVGGQGKAFTSRGMQFCVLNYCSLGSADVSLSFQDGTSAGNVFVGLDMENVNTDVESISGTVFQNTFIGGRWAYSTQGYNFNNGLSNVIYNPNIGASGGATDAMFYAGGQTGIKTVTDYPVTVTQPAVPATTVAQANLTGRDMIVNVRPGTATISAIVVNGTTTGAIAGQTFVKAGQSISLTYTAGTPTWTWTAL